MPDVSSGASAGTDCPAERVNSTRKKSREKEAINEKGQQCSKTKLSDLEQKILPLSESHKAVKAELAQLMKESNQLNQSLYKFPRFEETDEAKALQVKIKEAESAEDITATEAYQNLSHQAAELTDKIRRADVTLAAIRANDNGRERLRELRQQQTDTAGQLGTCRIWYPPGRRILAEKGGHGNRQNQRPIQKMSASYSLRIRLMAG